jgi:hypothetical protein
MGILHAYGETIHEVSLEQITGTQGSGSIFDPRLTTPNVAFYQLQAQSLIYKILGECAEKLQDDPGIQTERMPPDPGHSSGGEHISPLARSCRLALF